MKRLALGVMLCVLCAVFGVCGTILLNAHETVNAPSVSNAATVAVSPITEGVKLSYSDNVKIQSRRTLIGADFTDNRLTFGAGDDATYGGYAGYIGMQFRFDIELSGNWIFAMPDHALNVEIVNEDKLVTSEKDASWLFVTRAATSSEASNETSPYVYGGEFLVKKSLNQNKTNDKAAFWRDSWTGLMADSGADKYRIRIGLRNTPPSVDTEEGIYDVYATHIIDFYMVINYAPMKFDAKFTQGYVNYPFKVVTQSVNEGGKIEFGLQAKSSLENDYGIDLEKKIRNVVFDIAYSTTGINGLPDFLSAEFTEVDPYLDFYGTFVIKIKPGRKVVNGTYTFKLKFSYETYRVRPNGEYYTGEYNENGNGWSLPIVEYREAVIIFDDMDEGGFEYKVLFICLGILGGVGLIWYISTKMAFHMQVTAARRLREKEERAEARKRANMTKFTDDSPSDNS